MKQKNIITYAAHLNGTDYTKEDYQKGTAFFIGNEGNGLTDKLTDKVQKKIKIPMCGKVESLNAAMASGLLVYEARYVVALLIRCSVKSAFRAKLFSTVDIPC